MSETVGVVTASVLNLRAEPSTDGEVVGKLERGSRVTVLEPAGAWYRVAAGDLEGFVHGDWLTVLDASPAAGFLRDREDLVSVPLAPADAERIAIGPGFTAVQRQAAGTWNGQGGLLGTLSGAVRVPAAGSVAVLCVESGGRGFGADGRMVIRFENHHFWKWWGEAHAETFAEHFRFDRDKRWLGHELRAGDAEPWSKVHTGQAGEWRVFDFARGLDEAAAIRSISMGGPQILGSNHHLLGYDSPREMFDRFQADVRFQILGLFDFVKGPGTTSPMLEALRRGRFEEFASRYNGSGQAAEYGERIRSSFEAFEAVRPTAGEPA